MSCRADRIQIDIHSTSYGFVSPGVVCATHADASDDAMERAIAERAQSAELPAGIYVAKWVTRYGTSQYVFTVAVEETPNAHRVEVAE